MPRDSFAEFLLHSGVECFPGPRPDGRGLAADRPRADVRSLLDQLEAASRSGAPPQEMTLVRLGDGRIRILPPDDASARLRRLANEHGRPSAAYRVRADERGCEVEDWTGSAVVRYRRDVRPAQARLSRKSAIFLASFGITTGALPNVEVSRSPDGVSNSPVW